MFNTPEKITVQAKKSWSNQTDNTAAANPDVKAYLVAKFKTDAVTETAWLVPAENCSNMTNWILLGNAWSQDSTLPSNDQNEIHCKTLDPNGTKATWEKLPKNAVNYAYTESGASPSLGDANGITYQVYEKEKVTISKTRRKNGFI